MVCFGREPNFNSENCLRRNGRFWVMVMHSCSLVVSQFECRALVVDLFEFSKYKTVGFAYLSSAEQQRTSCMCTVYCCTQLLACFCQHFGRAELLEHLSSSNSRAASDSCITPSFFAVQLFFSELTDSATSLHPHFHPFVATSPLNLCMLLQTLPNGVVVQQMPLCCAMPVAQDSGELVSFQVVDSGL